MPIDSVGIVPCLNKLSVTVGTLDVDLTVLEVRSTGPMLNKGNSKAESMKTDARLVPQNSVDVVEPSGLGGNSDGLLLDYKVGTKSHLIGVLVSS
jgi:hypothetical protein